MQFDFKQYLLFSIYQFYPSGGLSDVKSSFDTKEEALKAFNEENCDWVMVWDRINNIVIAEKNN